MFNNVVEIIHFFITQFVKAGDTVVDATCGNGFDTLFLSNRVGETGKVFAFDVQEAAIEKTKRLLAEKSCYDNVKLFHDSNEFVLKYISKPISLCVFNLGYLPGSDKSIITSGPVTVRAIENVLALLKKTGLICIGAHFGHSGGLKEYETIKAYLDCLDCDVYNVIEMKHLNRHEDAPRILILEKK